MLNITDNHDIDPLLYKLVELCELVVVLLSDAKFHDTPDVCGNLLPNQVYQECVSHVRACSKKFRGIAWMAKYSIHLLLPLMQSRTCHQRPSEPWEPT